MVNPNHDIGGIGVDHWNSSISGDPGMDGLWGGLSGESLCVIRSGQSSTDTSLECDERLATLGLPMWRGDDAHLSRVLGHRRDPPWIRQSRTMRQQSMHVNEIWEAHRSTDWPTDLGSQEGELMMIDTVIDIYLIFYIHLHIWMILLW